MKYTTPSMFHPYFVILACQNTYLKKQRMKDFVKGQGFTGLTLEY